MLALALLALAVAAPPPDLVALGVVVSPRKDHSVVLLRAGGRTRVAAVGEMAFGGRVASVSAGRVTLDFESGPVELSLSSGEPGPANVALGPPAAPARPAGPVLDRREVERRLGEEGPRILAETTLVPVVDGGRVAGYTLSHIPENSLLTDAGLRPGDVLTEINEVPIDSMATLISLWPRLQNETTLRAVVLRDGRPVPLTVSLR